jgi:hypothetical protein
MLLTQRAQEYTAAMKAFQAEARSYLAANTSVGEWEKRVGLEPAKDLKVEDKSLEPQLTGKKNDPNLGVSYMRNHEMRPLADSPSAKGVVGARLRQQLPLEIRLAHQTGLMDVSASLVEVVDYKTQHYAPTTIHPWQLVNGRRVYEDSFEMKPGADGWDKYWTNKFLPIRELTAFRNSAFRDSAFRNSAFRDVAPKLAPIWKENRTLGWDYRHHPSVVSARLEFELKCNSGADSFVVYNLSGTCSTPVPLETLVMKYQVVYGAKKRGNPSEEKTFTQAYTIEQRDANLVHLMKGIELHASSPQEEKRTTTVDRAAAIQRARELLFDNMPIITKDSIKSLEVKSADKETPNPLKRSIEKLDDAAARLELHLGHIVDDDTERSRILYPESLGRSAPVLVRGKDIVERLKADQREGHDSKWFVEYPKSHGQWIEAMLQRAAKHSAQKSR